MGIHLLVKNFLSSNYEDLIVIIDHIRSDPRPLLWEHGHALQTTIPDNGGQQT